MNLSTGHVSRCDCGDRSAEAAPRGATSKERACAVCKREGRF